MAKQSNRVGKVTALERNQEDERISDCQFFLKNKNGSYTEKVL